MADQKKSKTDVAEGLRRAVQGVTELAGLERDEAVRRTRTQLDRVAREIQDVAHALHEASGSTQAAVSKALGNLRSSHAEAMRRLEDLQAAGADQAGQAKQTLSEALRQLQQRARQPFGG